jgi:hypothetical protein
VNRKSAIRVGALLTGYSAVLAGLFGLAVQPLVGVLMVLCGLALAVCSAVELVRL